jgi:hypothetical protein
MLVTDGKIGAINLHTNDYYGRTGTKATRRRRTPHPIFIPHERATSSGMENEQWTLSMEQASHGSEARGPDSIGCGSSQGAFMRLGGRCCWRSVTGGRAGVRG